MPYILLTFRDGFKMLYSGLLGASDDSLAPTLASIPSLQSPARISSRPFHANSAVSDHLSGGFLPMNQRLYDLLTYPLT